MSLAQIETGSKVLVENLSAGQRFRHRMAELGIFPGALIQVLRREGRGPPAYRQLSRSDGGKEGRNL